MPGTINAGTITTKLKVVTNMSDVTDNAKAIQQVLNKLTVPVGLRDGFTKLFNDIAKNSEKASDAMASGFKTKGDITKYESAMNRIITAFQQIQSLSGKISDKNIFDSYLPDAAKTKEYQNRIKQIKDELASTFNTQGLEAFQKNWNEFTKGGKKVNSGFQETAKFFTDLDSIDTNTIDKVTKAIEKLRTERNALKTDDKKGQYDKLLENLTQLQQVLSSSTIVQQLEALKAAQTDLNNADANGMQELVERIRELTGADLSKAIQGTEELAGGIANSALSTQQLNSDLEQFNDRIKYFFNASNAVQLFQRAIQSAYNTVKALDEVMTETAVVTDFDVGDMWDQLPEYTERANELGVSIQSAYEAATLYYQQGLKTNEVVSVSNETLKMARIAGLDAATATDRMTNALRGFNMELTESNAQNVNDVYSKLAAITASDVNEISTAMTKVASLANNANMSFESTAAFLSQIIETTRESAETAGTALKTVIARFSEVKTLIDSNQLTGTDDEGETVDVNKVGTALRTAGINLNEYISGEKGLDEIFMELAAKWDDLTSVQQRYIATMAAGSRQQSRFIALMQDYSRTVELVDAANNAAGASQEQFDKTLESLETKLNRLKNAWDEYTMGIANNEIIKWAVDALTNILELINKLTSSFGDMGNMMTKVGTAIGLFTVGKTIFLRLSSAFIQEFKDIGTKSGESFMESFKTTVTRSSTNLKNIFSKSNEITDAFNYSKTIKEDQTLAGGQRAGQVLSYFQNNQVVRDSVWNDYVKSVNSNATEKEHEQFNTEWINNAGDAFDSLNKKALEAGKNLKLTGDIGQSAGKAISGSMQTAAAGLSVLTMALGAISTLLKNNGEDEAAEFIETICTGLTILAGILVALPPLVKAVAGETTAAISSIPILGVIAVAITMVISLTTAIIKLHKTTDDYVEAAKNATEAAEEAVEAYNTLQDNLSEISDQTTAIAAMTEGTTEWADATKELNTQIENVLTNYSALAKFVSVDENGNLVMDTSSAEYQAANQSIQSATYQQAAGAAILNVDAQQRKLQDYINSNINGPMFRFRDRNGNDVGTSDEINSALSDILVSLQNDITAGSISNKTQLITAIESGMKGNNLFRGLTLTIEDGFSEFITKYRTYIGELDSYNSQIETYTKSALSNSILAANSDTYKNYSGLQNLFTTDKLTTLYEQAQKYVKDFNNSGSAFQEWFAEYNTGLGNIYTVDTNGTIKYTDENGKTKKIDSDTKNQIAASFVSGMVTAGIEGFSQISDNDIGKTVKKVWKKADGTGLTQKEISIIQGLGNEGFQEIWDSLSSDFQQWFDGESDFVNQMNAAANQSKETFETAYKQINNILGTTYAYEDNNPFSQQSGITADNVQSLATNLTSLATVSQDTAKTVGATVMEIANSLGDSGNDFLTAFNTINFSSIESLEGFIGTCEELGIVLTDDTKEKLSDLIDQIKELGQATSSVDAETAVEYIKTLTGLKNTVNSTGSTTLTSDQYEALIGAGMDEDKFVYNVDTGNYEYLGSITELLASIDTHIANLDNSANLSKAIASGSVVQSMQDNDSYINGVSREALQRAIYHQRGILYFNLNDVDRYASTDSNEYYEAFVQTYFNDLEDGVTGIIDEATFDTAVKNGNTEVVKTMYDTLIEAGENLANNIATQAEIAISKRRVEYQSQSVFTNTASYLNNSSEAEDRQAAIIAQASAAGISGTAMEELKELLSTETITAAGAKAGGNMTFFAQLASSLGLDVEQVQDYAQMLEKSGYGVAEAWSTAFTVMAQNSGVQALIDNIDDLTDAFNNLEDGIFGTSVDGAKGLSAIADALKEIFGITVDINDSAFNTETIIGAVQDYVNGDTTALDKVRNQIGNAVIGDLVSQGKVERATGSKISRTLRQAGADEIITPDELASIQSAVEGLTEKQITSILGAYGFSSTFDNGALSSITRQSVSANVLGSTYNELTSGAASAQWENTFTKLYKIQQELNNELRTRNKLEEEYNDLLNKESSVELRTQNLSSQKDSLSNAKANYESQEKIIRDQLDNAASHQYNGQTYQAAGVAGYLSINYDNFGGAYIQPQDNIETLQLDADTGAALDDYREYLEELCDSYNEVLDELDDIQDEIDSYDKDLLSTFADVKDEILSAYVAAQQKQIDALSDLNDKISSDINDVLNAVQNQIDQQRQERDTQEAKDDIADKQAQLAYLQRDTSGVYALQIAQLQEEIANDQQDLEDNLVDNALQNLQDAATTAEDQRNTQIELLNQILQNQQDDGSIWDQVRDLINNSLDENKDILTDSTLVQMMRDNSDYYAMSAENQKLFDEELTSKLKNFVAIFDYLSTLGSSSYRLNQYASGGINTTTGPAWLDGTPSQPELVLNSADTQNFLNLTDVLRNLANPTSNTTTGSNYINIDINAAIDSDYSVDQLVERVKEDIAKSSGYRNNTMLGFSR